MDYYRKIGDILGSGGVDYAIIPVGDPRYENDDKTTVTTVGSGDGDGLVFNYSKNRQTWDEPTTYDGRGNIPDQPFDGTDEEIDTDDAAFWTRGNGTADSVFSWGLWLQLSTAPSATNMLFSRLSASAGREYYFYVNSSSKIIFTLYDNSRSGSINQSMDAALSVGAQYFVVGTYDATEANTGIILYKDGLVAASTAAGASYTAMENLNTTTNVGHEKGGGSDAARFFLDGKLGGGPLGMFFAHRTLSAQDVWQLYQIGLEARSQHSSLWLPMRRAA